MLLVASEPPIDPCRRADSGEARGADVSLKIASGTRDTESGLNGAEDTLSGKETNSLVIVDGEPDCMRREEEGRDAKD